jgi:HEAT repeat protein
MTRRPTDAHISDLIQQLSAAPRQSRAHTIRSMIEASQSTDHTTRTNASAALRHIGEASVIAVDRLCERIYHLDDDAGRVWGQIPQIAAAAVNELIALLAMHAQQRSIAIRAMKSIAEGASVAVKRLIQRTTNDDDYARSAAISTLGTIAQGLSGAVEQLVQMMADGDRNTHLLAAALGCFADVLSTALDGLIGRLADDNHYVRLQATLALGWIGRISPLAVERLIERLPDNDAGRPPTAVAVLRFIGKTSLLAVERLVEVMAHDHEDINRATAIESLVQIGEGVFWAVGRLSDYLRDDDFYVRAYAAWALGHIGEISAPAAMAALTVAYRREENDEVRRTICEAVLTITQAAKAKGESAYEQAAPFFLQVRTGDPSEVVRIQANMGLDDLRTGDPSGIPLPGDVSDFHWPALADDGLPPNLKQLYVAYLTRLICQDTETNRFSCQHIAAELKAQHRIRLSDGGVAIYLADTEEYFQNHFNDKTFTLFHRQRRIGYEFHPVHRDPRITRAWDFLTHLFAHPGAVATARAALHLTVDKR